MILGSSNQNLAEQYYNTLPSRDISRRYYEDGLKYQRPTSFFSKLASYNSIDEKIDTLVNFYPYQKIVKGTRNELDHQREEDFKTHAIFTGISWFTIYNFGRRGVILPFLGEKGFLFGTHRIVRHYLYSLAAPYLYFAYKRYDKFTDHVEALWLVHANRLNQKILSDPDGTYYPEELVRPLRITYA